RAGPPERLSTARRQDMLGYAAHGAPRGARVPPSRATSRDSQLTQEMKRTVHLVRSHGEDDEVPSRLPKLAGATQDGEPNGGGGRRERSHAADGDLALSEHGVAEA